LRRARYGIVTVLDKTVPRVTKATKTRQAKAAATEANGVAWTDRHRGQTYATRALPNPLHLTGGMHDGPCWVLDEVPWPYDLDTAWREALDRSWGLVEWALPPNAVLTGLPHHATPELAALATRARAAFGVRLETLDADVEAAMAVLGLRASRHARHGTAADERAPAWQGPRERTVPR
jgi:hypothetical protein